jgi:hypothetical protein
MAGAACATGDVPGGAVGGAAGIGATGAGATIVAPGDPVTPVMGPAAGADVTDWGATRLCTCAGDDLGNKSGIIAARFAAISPRHKPPNFRPLSCCPTTCPVMGFFSVAIAAISSRLPHTRHPQRRDLWPSCRLVHHMLGRLRQDTLQAIRIGRKHDPEKWKPVFGQDHAQTIS